MNTIFSILEEEKIVPVIKLNSPSHAVPLADALLAGGIGVAKDKIK